MLFVFLGVDKPEQKALRSALLSQHREYLRKIARRIAFAGPLSSDQGTEVSGSLLVIDFTDHKEARAWIDEEPYAKAGLYESVTVRSFVNRWPQRTGIVTAPPKGAG